MRSEASLRFWFDHVVSALKLPLWAGVIMVGLLVTVVLLPLTVVILSTYLAHALNI